MRGIAWVEPATRSRGRTGQDELPDSSCQEPLERAAFFLPCCANYGQLTAVGVTIRSPVLEPVNTPYVFVSVEALCLLPGDPSPTVRIIEEYMPVGPIFRAETLKEAVDYFLSMTDVTTNVQEVRSFKVNGHELLHTFGP